MDKIDELLRFLSDGSWHTIDEAAKSLQTTPEKLEKMAKLLEEFNFIQFDGRNLRITKETKKILETIPTGIQT